MTCREKDGEWWPELAQCIQTTDEGLATKPCAAHEEVDEAERRLWPAEKD